MIRVLCQICDTCPDGSKVGVRFKSFDVEAAELEAFLRSFTGYETRTAIGVELLDVPSNVARPPNDRS